MTRAQCLLWTALLTPSLAAAAEITAQGVQAEIDRLGAQKTVTDLDSHGGRQWEAFLRGVESGRQEWLALVPNIKPGTDAGTAESLLTATSMALSRNAAGTLALVPATYALSALCTVPLIEPTEAQVKDFKRRTFAALDKAVDGPAGEKASDCRRMLADER